MDLYEIRGSGFGPFLKPFKLRLDRQGLVWVTAENRDTKSATNNGSGKTHLFKAIGWCLFGDSVDGYKGDEVIHERAKRAEVTCTFGDNPKAPWELTRWRTKGAPRLKLVSPEGEQMAGRREEIQERVDKLLGMDFLSFRNTALYGQDDTSRFAHPRTTDSQRKEVLQRITRTGIFQSCKESAQETSKQLSNEIAELERKSQNSRDKAAEHDCDALEGLGNDWEEQRALNVADFREEASEWRRKAKEKDDIAVDLEALGERIELLKEEVMRGNDASDKLEKLDRKIEKHGHSLAKAQRALDKAKVLVENTRQAVSRLTGSRCPLCTTPLSEGVAHDHVKELEGAHKKALLGHKDAAQSAKSAQERLDVLVDQRKPLRDKVREGTAAASKLADAKEERAEAIAEQERAADRRRHALERAKMALEQAKSLAAEINPYATQIDEAKVRVKHLISEAEKWDREAEAKRLGLSHIEFWTRGFSNQGIPSFILDATMPILTDRTNHYLRTLADGDIQVEFSTQRELKSARGEFRDEISIAWNIEGIEGKAPSGGQLKKMDLATDFGLMDLMAHRESGRTNILVLDEVLDGLDAEGRSRVLLLLQELRAKIGSVFVISHDPNMAEIFEKSVTVVKEDACSTLKVSL